MHFRDLKADLDRGNKQNFYIFTGEEKEIMRKYIKRIDPKAKEAESFKSLANRFRNVGLFNKGEHGTFYIYNDKTAFEFDIKKMIRLIGPYCVILIYDSADMRTTFFKSAYEFVYGFPKFDSETLANYVHSLIDIDDNLAIELCRLCNNDVARVELECDKLARLETKITRSLLHESVIKQAEDVIFDMIKETARRDRGRVYSLLQELRERRESPIKIISLLYTTFRNVVIIQSYQNLTNNEIAQKTGLSAGQIYYQRELLNAFDIDSLKNHLLLIQQAEVDIKTGKLDQDIALDALLLKILR